MAKSQMYRVTVTGSVLVVATSEYEAIKSVSTDNIMFTASADMVSDKDTEVTLSSADANTKLSNIGILQPI